MSAEPSALTITGVPESVSREQVCEAIRILGIDPSEVAGLSFEYSAVHVEVYANQKPTSTPTWRWTYNGKRAATHRLTIPIIDKEPT